MRERLEAIIGQAAYHGSIHTFHSFGGEIINQYPDYFARRPLIQQIDELGSYELLRNIFEDLPHSNPLSIKVGEDFIMLKDTLDAISWLKQNAVSPVELHEILLSNKKFMDKLAGEIKQVFAVPTSPKHLSAYKKLLASVKNQTSDQRLFGFPLYANECAVELKSAIEQTNTTGRYAPPMTAWRNRWCEKNADGDHVFKDSGKNYRKLHALANVYQQIQDNMAKQGLFDFDDMIIETVHALENNKDLKANLQERYFYVLVDEFQDTNKAQLRMLEALGDNPLFEGKPNIMAVGDDDQAIYAFQGAEVSNMVGLTKLYKNVERINLSDNYRSSSGVIDTSQKIADQITDRLADLIPGAKKELVPKISYAHQNVEHVMLSSELAQYDWVAGQIQKLIQKGTEPEHIAVLGPRHRYLERLIPYLAARHIPVAYERRENILDSPIIIQLIDMARLVVAMSNNQQNDVDALISEVLGYEFWGIDADVLLKISLECYKTHSPWLGKLVTHKDKKIRQITSWLVELSKKSRTEPLEYMLDQLMGALPDSDDLEYKETSRPQKATFVSPMRSFYFGAKKYEAATDEYLALLGQLSTLRQRLRQWKPNVSICIRDLVEFAELHSQAKLKIIDSNPHTQSTNAVQVMTAYKAKGLEFDYVFLINIQDEIWGPTARQRSSRMTLPKNLPIAPAGDADNDKLRLLYVAMTRAKNNLTLTSYTHDLGNKLSPPLSFTRDVDEKFLPKRAVSKPANVRAVEILSTDWSYRFRQIIADKPALLKPILDDYKLSVTHLNNFIDVVDGGPQFFFMHNLLRFPRAPTAPAAYGDAVHKTLQWLYGELKQSGQLPKTKAAQTYFEDMLVRKHLRTTDYKKYLARGKAALSLYLGSRGKSFSAQDLVERGFNNDGVVVDGAILSGKIDKLSFGSPGSVQVIDFKTGKPTVSWQGKDGFEKIKLHKYRQQLLFYKFLVEHSASFGGKVTAGQGELEFIEANDQNKLVDNLILTYEAKELGKFQKLIGAVWLHISELNFPDVSAYDKSLKGIEKFEDDLIAGTI